MIVTRTKMDCAGWITLNQTRACAADLSWM